ncbi:MAG: hypothetical protein WCZ86_05615 [Desulfurivibrionaceae bacterium]|jgi:hypothetical protein
MRRQLCNLANIILRPLKLTALKAKDLSELIHFQEKLIALYNERCEWDRNHNDTIACVVFSKDRAMQLHAFLTSFQEKVTPSITAHVLYHTSNKDHRQSYDDLQQLHRGLPVLFHRQTNNTSFRNDLISLLTDFHESKIVFFVDDIVVTESIDLNDLLRHHSDKFVPSLRMGLNIKRNYTINTPQPLPDFQNGQTSEPGKIMWPWSSGILDWGYPLSVDGHIFSRQELLAMIKLIHFSAPNTLEDALQSFNPLFTNRLGIAYAKSKIMNIPCNKVQEENKNISGNIHQDLLLKKWKDGFAIDLKNIYGYTNASPHEEIDIRFIRRNNFT